MSKYDRYRVQAKTEAPSTKYAKYKITSEPQETPSFLDRVGQYGKGLLSGFTRSGLEEAGNQSSHGVMEVGPGIVSPVSESSALANIPQKGVEALESLRPKENDNIGNILHHAGEFGGGVASFPLSPTGAGSASLLSKFGKQLGTGSAIGGTSGVLQNNGVDPLQADILSSIALPSGVGLAKAHAASSGNLLRNFTEKLPTKVLGLSPKSLNVEAAQAARDLGVDLPAAVLTDSKLTGLANEYIKKTPYFGNKLDQKYFNAEEQIKKSLEDIYNKTGPAKTPEIEEQILRQYDNVAKTLPKEATVTPTNLKKAIDEIKVNTAILSPDEKKLLDSLETIKHEIEPTSKIVSQYGPIKLPLQELNVDKLIGTKRSLNNIIKWDTDEGVKNQLRNLQKGISKDIAEYGKTNPQWYKTFKEADKLYADVAKREKLEGLLTNKSLNQATDNLSYNALSKTINEPKNLSLIKRQVDPETFEKIKKLGTVAQALTIKSKNISNPSGTALTTANIAALLNGIYNPVQGLATVGGYQLATKLLTDKKFVDLALKFAENEAKGGKTNPMGTMALNKRIKDITGYSAVSLQRELERGKGKEKK